MPFRKHDCPLALERLQKAIAVDPDQETGHRYWGDALQAAADAQAALARDIDAVVAEPYNRKPWLGLAQWAQNNGARPSARTFPCRRCRSSRTRPARIRRCSRIKRPAPPGSPTAWTAPSGAGRRSRRAFRGEDLPPLVALGQAGMLEPYVLINAADQGIAADYPAYRASHRQQLHACVERFLVQRDAGAK